MNELIEAFYNEYSDQFELSGGDEEWTIFYNEFADLAVRAKLFNGSLVVEKI